MLQPQATPEVAPKLAARQARGEPPQEVQKVAPGERAQTAAEPVTYLNMEDCEALGWTDDPSRGRKNVRRIMDGQCCRPISARDHACELLAWLRAHPLLVDQLVPATDLAVFYRGYCRSINLKELPWQPVATQLNRLTGGRRLYRWVDGRKLRVYHIHKKYRHAIFSVIYNRLADLTEGAQANSARVNRKHEQRCDAPQAINKTAAVGGDWLHCWAAA